MNFIKKGLIVVGILASFGYTMSLTSITEAKTKSPILSCKPGQEISPNGKRCNVCQPGNISSNGVSCRACRGDNIAKRKGSSACTPCPTGMQANNTHTACIKQKFVSGERL